MSAAPGALAAYRPALRPRVLLSDPLLDGAATVHLIKDAGTGNSFKVGPKEHFLIARMDGERSLAEIGEAYAGEYGRRLGDAHWQRLLALLGAKGLLAGAPEPKPAPTSAPPKPAPSSVPPEKRTLLRGSLPLVADADATTARLHRVFGFLLAPAVMVPLLALVLAMEAVVVARSGELLLAVRGLMTHPVLLTSTAVLLWVSTALHELAHGVVARHHGGRVAEIGLRWRLPAVIMYCTVDDYLYLGTRRHRIATAAAGAVMNLVFLLPFCALWLFAPLDDATHEAFAALLFLGSVQAFTMLVPLPPLDGYKIACQLAGATGLAASAGGYLRLALRRSPEAAAYPRRARIAYPLYAVATVLVLAAAVAAAVAGVHHLLTA
ncbi:M50 family metallopeptidase [Streptomyces globisporus]|uniref:M50 family metallopeptidase n=1 Tax=Streptomyces TaxID=1883 RepID=UPI0004C60571|nr:MULTISPECIES: M50 family metallopeptidase [Streptomyces]PPA41879.1 peptidase M50 [Streptomyces griseus]RAN19190.1 peptidase M50 [Streptomyces badius]AWL88007.1 peptidase M50 [Streptomyces globisporus]RAN27100.1 peptidase M50 [Streptomyces badius]WSF78580.1 M50 family metallopeptidase [Streptomyces globisporus]